MNKITSLITTKKTIFTYAELQNIFSYLSKRTFEQFLARAKQQGDLLNPMKGIWALPAYDVRELACKMKKESYISLETVLYDVGAIFQAYFHTTTCIASKQGSFSFKNHEYKYSKLKDEIFQNSLCIKAYDNYRLAMPERALCDYLYLYPRASLDNPEAFYTLNAKARFKKLFPLYPKTTQNTIRNLLHLEEI
jgi:hypothetical protein